MSVRVRAALLGAILAIVAAPAADAATQKKLADFRLASLKISKNTVTAGDTIVASGRVQNRKGRRAQTARVTYTLRKGRTSKSGRRLGGDNVKRTKAGRFRAYSERLRIASNVAPGTYYLTACVRRGSGTLKAECARRQLKVTARPAPPTPPGPPADNRSMSQKLRDAITAQNMTEHLKAFQKIADEHGGNRASGYQGYGASVQYVLSQLRAAGYNPTTQVFDFTLFSELSPPVFEKTAPPPTQTYGEDDFGTMEYSGSGDVEAPVQGANDNQFPPGPTASSSSAGCEDADFAGFTAGNIALVQRGSCDFVVKARNAKEAGAAAVIIFNEGQPGRTDPIVGTLGDPRGDQIGIPVIGTSFAIGQQLSAPGSRAHVATDTLLTEQVSTNVLADTAGGNPNRVIVSGAHLDSVAEGPGINDNGTGSAFVLETALQMARMNITPTNRIRFAFWGAEESGLIGATRYIEEISQEEYEKLAANLNFDMLGSPNHGKFVYDGDFSDSTPPASAPDVNPGAARIEKEFVDYFNSVGIPTEPTAFDGRSDYKPFQDVGVPAGGLFSGAEVPKTPAQAAKWGGTPGVAFDPNYHQAGDTINNIDPVGFEQLADGGAHVTGVLATDQNLRNVSGGAAPSFRSKAARAGSGRGSIWLGKHMQR